MPKYGCIDDLIIAISDAGFGSYALKDLISINDINVKIDILTSLINKIQKFKEILIIEDDETIIALNGDIKYWFYNAIKASNNGLAIILTSTVNVQHTYSKNYPEIFFQNLTELNSTEILGLLRSYSNYLGLDLSLNDRLYFKDCLTGYPPQIKYCADLIKDEGIDYAKDNTIKIAEMPEQISATILEQCKEKCSGVHLDGLLSIIAQMEIAPIKLLNKICKIDKDYRNALNILKQFSVCYVIGANGEYLKLNAFIEDFVTRNRIGIPDDIQNIIDDELNLFNDFIEKDEELLEWDNTELKFYVKKNLKLGRSINNSFLYSTIILQTVCELYNEQKYSQTIDLILLTKERPQYQYFDESIISTLQRYLCQSMIKNKNKNFEAEVEYFGEKKLWIQYHFLKGFWYRYIGNYDKAEYQLRKALEHNPNHLASKRELVIVLLSIQDFDTALSIARNNYLRQKNNIYHLQAYLECLLEQKELPEKQSIELDEMLTSLKSMHRISPSPIYYQLMGKYEAYKCNNIKLGLEYINDGIQKYPTNFYLLRDKFDIYRRSKDVEGMEVTVKQLSISLDEYQYKGVVLSRTAILKLYQGIPESTVRLELQSEGFSEKFIQNIIKKGPTH